MELAEMLLDTSAYSAFKRGHGEVIELVRSAGRVLLPAVVVGELLAGFEFGARRERNRAELDEFLTARRVTVTPITRSTAERYAVIYRYLRDKGTPVPANDLWIAATAMEHGAVVVTTDGHFSQMPQVISILLES